MAVTDKDVSVAEPGEGDCRSLADVLSRVGDKWTVMVVGSLSAGPVRYNALLKQIGGVSPRMLTLTLKGLVADGLVSRTMYPSIPPRVDYELTPLGRTLIEPLMVLLNWARSHREEIEQARASAAEAEVESREAMRLPPQGPPR